MSSDVIEELERNLRNVAHLPLSEQLDTFEKELAWFEQHIVGVESNRMPETEILSKLIQASGRYPKNDAKAMFMGSFSPWKKRIDPMIEYLTILHEAFPKSDRVASLKNRYVSMSDFFMGAMLLIAHY